MSKINYLNMDDGEIILSTADEFSETAIDSMGAWLLEAVNCERYVALPAPLSSYNALVNRNDDGLVCSIYCPAEIIPADVLRKRGEDVPPEGLPLLIFGVALDKGKNLWDFFTQGFYVGDRAIQMPEAPWIIVMPYQMYRYLPDPERLVSFQKCVARSWLKGSEQ